MPQGWNQIAPHDLWPWLVIGASAVALGVILLLVSRLMRRRDPLESQRPTPLSPAQQRALERDVSNLIAAMSEMGRQVSAQLDGRTAQLERLIRSADERIDRLEQLLHEMPASREPAAPNVIIGQLDARPPAETDPRHADIYSLADQGLGVAEIAQRLSRPKGEVELILALRPRRAG